jgi:hypothetical protein
VKNGRRFADRLQKTLNRAEELRIYPVTRSTSDPPTSFTFSTPSVTAVVVCCANSFATRVTRDSALVLSPPLLLVLMTLTEAVEALAGFALLALVFFTAGRFAARRVAFFGALFRAALRGTRFAAARFAGRFAGRFTADFFLALAFVPPRLLPFLPPDFPRDFLARVAMILLLGVGSKKLARG